MKLSLITCHVDNYQMFILKIYILYIWLNVYLKISVVYIRQKTTRCAF